MFQFVRHAEADRPFPRSIHRIRQLKPPFAPQALVSDEKFLATREVSLARRNSQKVSELVPKQQKNTELRRDQPSPWRLVVVFAVLRAKQSIDGRIEWHLKLTQHFHRRIVIFR